MKYLPTVAAICFIIGVFIYWVKSPQLTYMQVFLAVWPYWLVAIVLISAVTWRESK